MKKKLITAVVATAAVLALAGCGTVQGDEKAGEPYPATHYTFYQELPNGNKVLCVWAKSGYGAGLSCDFAGDSVVRE